MRKTTASFVFATILLGSIASAQFQPPSGAAGSYEEPPILDAATILRPEFVEGAGFKVRASVPTYAGHNQYVIDSDFGVFEAEGNAELAQRVAEIRAIAQLREVSRTDQYKDALKGAAQSPVKFAKNLAENPAKTISGIPKGLFKFINRAGQSVKEVGEEREHNPYEDSSAESLIGFSKAKRDLALKLGVDPYSSNETFQKELNGIAWASFAGKMTMTLALAPVGGGAGAVISGVNISETASQALADKSPNDLRRLGLEKLLALGVPREDAIAFLNNPAYSPTHATLFLAAIEGLRGVEGLASLVRLATEATDETDAIFFQRTAQALAQTHRDTPLKAVDRFQGFPVAFAADGTVVVAVEWDYATWTENAAKFVQAIKTGSRDGWMITGSRFVLTGVASDRTKSELAALGIGLVEKALPGPLR